MPAPRLLSVLSGVAALVAAASPLPAQYFFPPPPTPAGNPVTAEKALLGMALFWEEQLSSTDAVACGTCHQFPAGGADPRAMRGVHPGSDGIFGTADDRHGSPGVPQQSAAATLTHSEHFGFGTQVTPRRAPTVINAAYQPFLFYDGRAANGTFQAPGADPVVLTGPVALENLIVGPPLNPVEMGHPGRTWDEVAAKIAAAVPLRLAANLPPRLAHFVQARSYPDLFRVAFGDNRVTPARIVMAIATYLRTLVSDQAPFDHHLNRMGVLTPQQGQGLLLFTQNRGNAAACAACHGDLDSSTHTTGPIPPRISTYAGLIPGQHFHNIGVTPVLEDPGRQGVTQLTGDAGKFRIPSLRNVALTAPYFHDGSARTLREVLEFYNRGGDVHSHQSPGILPRGYTDEELDALAAILEALTDPRVRDGLPPFDQPTLGSARGAVPVHLLTGSVHSGGTVAEAVAPVAPLAGSPRFTMALQRAVAGSAAMLLWDPTGYEPGWNIHGMRFVLGLSPALSAFPVGVTVPSWGGGILSTSFPIPGAPQLVGTRLYGQWLLTDPSAPLGLVTSTGLRLTVH